MRKSLLLSALLLSACGGPVFVHRTVPDPIHEWDQRLSGSQMTIRFRDGSLVRGATIVDLRPDSLVYLSGSSMVERVPLSGVVAVVDEGDDYGVLKGVLIGGGAAFAISSATTQKEEDRNYFSFMDDLARGASIMAWTCAGALTGGTIGGAIGGKKHHLMSRDGTVWIRPDSLISDEDDVRFRWSERWYEMDVDDILDRDSTMIRIAGTKVLAEE